MTNNNPIRLASDFEQLYPEGSRRATASAMSLVYTADLIQAQISKLLQPFDLTPASGLVLSILTDSEGPLSPHEIAERLIISRAAVTGLVDSLERRHYARRSPHPTDRRMLLVEVTDKGREIANAFRPLVHRHERSWFEALDEADHDRLLGFLQSIQRNLAGLDS